MKRTPFPPRTSRLGRGHALARSPFRRRQRSKAELAAKFAREYGGEARLTWIQRLPSIVSGHGPCVAAHVATGGTSRKADACWTVPLTVAEHHELHQHGQQTFEAKYGINLRACAAEIERAWQRRVA